MDKCEKHKPQTPTFQMSDRAMEKHMITETRHAVSELLEDAGNRRQSIDRRLGLPFLSDSLLSEQQKLRHVLDWADRFLCSGSEVCDELCRADRGTEKRSPAYKHSSTVEYHCQVFSAADNNEVFEGGGSLEKVWQPRSTHYKNSKQNNCVCKPPFSCDLHIPISFSQGTDEKTWPENRETDNLKSMVLQHTTNKQTPSRDNRRASGLRTSNQTHHTDTSDSSTNHTLASDAVTSLIKESTSSWSQAISKNSAVFGAVSVLKHKSNDFTHKTLKTAGAQSNEDTPENLKRKEVMKMEEDEKEELDDDRMEEIYGKMHKEQESGSDSVVYSYNKIIHSEPENTPEQMGETTNPSCTCHLKLPSKLTVYEQYQLCVDHLRKEQNQHTEPGCFTQSHEKERRTSETTTQPASGSELNSHVTNPEIKKHPNNTASTRVTALETTERRCSHVISHKQDSCKHNRATLGETEPPDGLTVKETHVAIEAESRRSRQNNTHAHLDCNGRKHCDVMKKTTKDKTSTEEGKNMLMEHLTTKPDDVQPGEESAALTVNSDLRQNTIRCYPERKGTEARSLWRVCENSSMSSSQGILPRSNQRAIQCTKELDNKKHTKGPDDRDEHTILQHTETHTLHREDPAPTSLVEGTMMNNNGCKYSPAGVPVCDRWLCLPDEVWLSILSRVSHRDLCRVLQVCHRLHSLATDHTLWKNVQIENSVLTDQWLLCVARRRPHSLSLYNCSGLSVSSCGLEMFFSLCRASLEELKITSCTGPGLHGDQMLFLIGQLCDHVTSVDVSWSGATDTGVKNLSDSGRALRLKSVVLNGCHVTDVPLKQLVTRHKESLSRLEVFGCQLLTPSSLQTVYEMCPSLQHLNIGRVPKVNTHSLTVMASQLKCLISLNVAGLQVVNDATVDILLQNCVELQSLTFSSCPGVTDLTLHNIRKYTPCIRSLNVSGCKAVTDAGVQSLALGCRRLQQLDLSSTSTGNRGVSLLANYCSGHLHTVKLSFCHITAEKILKLCRHCMRLKVLHLYGCVHLPTEGQIREVNSTVEVYPPPRS